MTLPASSELTQKKVLGMVDLLLRSIATVVYAYIQYQVSY